MLGCKAQRTPLSVSRGHKPKLICDISKADGHNRMAMPHSSHPQTGHQGVPRQRNPGRSEPLRRLTLAMKVRRDYTIHKADYRAAWKHTSQALGLPTQETLTRAEELAKGLSSATEKL